MQQKRAWHIEGAWEMVASIILFLEQMQIHSNSYSQSSMPSATNAVTPTDNNINTRTQRYSPAARAWRVVQKSPLIWSFAFLSFSSLHSVAVWKQISLSLTYPHMVRSSLTLRHDACILSLTSPHHVGIWSSHVITRRRGSTVKSDILRAITLT